MAPPSAADGYCPAPLLPQTLSPLQKARAIVASWPYYPGACAACLPPLSCLLSGERVCGQRLRRQGPKGLGLHVAASWPNYPGVGDGHAAQVGAR